MVRIRGRTLEAQRGDGVEAADATVPGWQCRSDGVRRHQEPDGCGEEPPPLGRHPPAKERREHPGRSTFPGHGRLRLGREQAGVRHEVDTVGLQHTGHGSVAPSSEGRVVATDHDHRCRNLPRERRDDVPRPPDPHAQPGAAFGKGRCQRIDRVEQERCPIRRGEPPGQDRRIEDEQGRDGAAGGGVHQGGMVMDAEVAAKPNDRR